MAKAKTIFKELIPPVIARLSRSMKKKDVILEPWTGNYHSWGDAKSNSTDYDSNLILNKCKSALLKVRNGEAAYERDSILFDEIQYSWGLLAGLQRAAIENEGELTVLDFGGSLGSSYYQNRSFLKSLKKLKWCIVEQENFVRCGKESFENDELCFYYTIEECLKTNKPNVVLLSSVLQYLEKPELWINKIMELNIKYIILDRLALADVSKDILTIQNVSKEFYESKLRHWFFSENNFLRLINGKYIIIANTISYADPPYILNNKINCFFKLLILKSK